MKALGLQLKTRIWSANIANSVPVEGIASRAMLSILGGLALLYVLILGNIIFDIMQRKSLEQEALALSLEVRELESSYLSALDDIDVAKASSMGFKEVKATFATHKSLGYNTLNNKEILENLKLVNNEI